MYKATTQEFENACFRILAWYLDKGTWPSVHVPINGNLFTADEWRDAVKRAKAYYDKNGKMAATVRFGEEVKPTPVPQPTPTPAPQPVIQTETIYLRKNPDVYIPQVYMFQQVVQTKTRPNGEKYYSGFLVDGKFGDATEQAVKDVQEDNNIEQTGGIGCLTWNAGVYAPCPFSGDPNSAGSIQTAVQNTLGSTFTTFTQFYNLMKGRGYSYYYNDVKTLYEEETTCAYLNCADSSQLAVLLAREMGYEAKFVKCVCTVSGSGHIRFLIRGKEFGDWTMVDMAACLSVGSQYDIGNSWCSDAKYWIIADPWIEVDDGIT